MLSHAPQAMFAALEALPPFPACLANSYSSSKAPCKCPLFQEALLIPSGRTAAFVISPYCYDCTCHRVRASPAPTHGQRSTPDVARQAHLTDEDTEV